MQHDRRWHSFNNGLAELDLLACGPCDHREIAIRVPEFCPMSRA